MANNPASADSPLVQLALDLEEQAVLLLREAEAEAVAIAAAARQTVDEEHAAARTERARRVERLESEARLSLEKAVTDLDVRHAALLAAVVTDRPERTEAAVDYLLSRLKDASP